MTAGTRVKLCLVPRWPRVLTIFRVSDCWISLLVVAPLPGRRMDIVRNLARACPRCRQV